MTLRTRLASWSPVLAASGLVSLLRVGAAAFSKLRGKPIVTCPETNAPVGADVEALYASATAP